MINSVRNTVLFLLNKDNRGYLAPSEFDYFAKQAQLEIFEGYFADYARAIKQQNKRARALSYGDDAMHIQNKIDVFATSGTLTYVDVSPTGIGDEDYLSVPDDFYKLINVTVGGKVVQEVAKHKFDMIVDSNYTAPSKTFPIYKREGAKLYVQPSSLYNNSVTMNYIRKPADPHWGYNTISGDPVYNADSSVDFEIPMADETELVVKICKLSGLNIREKDVIEVANAMEQIDFQQENI